MNTQPEALRLADLFEVADKATPGGNEGWLSVAAELRRLHEVNKELLEVLKVAVRQNSHDMLMTGEELRQCEAAIAKAEAA